MKNFLLILILLLSFVEGNSKESLFFLSSDRIVQEKQNSLQSFHSFNFFPILKIDKEKANKILKVIDQELEKAAILIKQPILTSEGAELQSFSLPTLQFTLEQLVDQKNKPLPMLQATLKINQGNELNINNINYWSTYIAPSNNLEKIVKETLSNLLQQFSADFQNDHGTNEKPKIYICYDSSWWKK